MKKVSVIVPVYNVEKYLCRCIDSIINQKNVEMELILVDDGSTDKSGEICDNYANIYTKIKVIHKENGGLSDARNVGIENSIGEYIFFLDSDDYIDCKVLEILYLNIKKYNAGISTCEYKIVSEKSNYLNEVKFLEEIKYKYITK